MTKSTKAKWEGLEESFAILSLEELITKTSNENSPFHIENPVSLKSNIIEASIKKLLSQTEQEVKERIIKNLPKRTTHICRFNDVDCVCRCYESAINETEKAINNLK